MRLLTPQTYLFQSRMFNPLFMVSQHRLHRFHEELDIREALFDVASAPSEGTATEVTQRGHAFAFVREAPVSPQCADRHTLGPSSALQLPSIRIGLTKPAWSVAGVEGPYQWRSHTHALTTDVTHGRNATPPHAYM